jgi:hypothetical protein
MTQHIVEAAKEFVRSRNCDHPVLELDEDGEPLEGSYFQSDCDWILLESFEFLSAGVVRYCTEDDEYLVEVKIRCSWSTDDGATDSATYHVYVPADVDPKESHHFEFDLV